MTRKDVEVASSSPWQRSRGGLIAAEPTCCSQLSWCSAPTHLSSTSMKTSQVELYDSLFG